MSRVGGQIFCDDCAGWDIEWMYHCKQHGTDRCRGCSCPECEEESWDDYEEDGPQDLETTLDSALERIPERREDGMAEHETSIGASDDWYTPPEILDALGETYDLDPCAPEYGRAFYSVRAAKEYTIEHDGLAQPWEGFVFMNPPFGGRNGHVPWLEKFLAHGNGIAIVRAYTSAAWFHEHAVKADAMLFPRGKTKFVRPDGSIGKAPGHGVVLLGMGERARKALERSKLGLFLCLPSD